MDRMEETIAATKEMMVLYGKDRVVTSIRREMLAVEAHRDVLQSRLRKCEEDLRQCNKELGESREILRRLENDEL